MPSPYAGRSPSGSGSAYSGRGNRRSGPVTQPTKKPRGSVLGAVSRGLGDLETAAVNSPDGIYQLAKATGHDTAAAFGHIPGASPYAKRAASEPSQLKPLAAATYHGFGEDIHHPLRHPGFTALDILAAASLGAGTIARGAAVAGKIGEGARGAELVDAALRAPKPGLRTLRAGPLEVTKPASRSALTRGVVRQIDALRNRFPDAHLPVQDQYTRVGRELGKQRSHDYLLHTTPFEELKVAGRRIGANSPRGRALRAVAEGTPLETVIRTATADLAKATDKLTRKQLRREIRIAREARQYVNDVTLPDGTLVPRLADPKLQRLYEQTKAASLLEDARIAEAKIATPGQLTEAIQKPGRIYQGATYEARAVPVTSPLDVEVGSTVRVTGQKATGKVAEVNRDGSLTVYYPRFGRTVRLPAHSFELPEPARLHGAEDFQGGEFHVGQETRRKAFSIRKPPALGGQGSLGRPRAPGRLTHALKGDSIHSGGLRHDTPRLVAENALESERHAALLRAADFFAEHAQETPAGISHPVPIRLAELKDAPFPEPVKLLQDAYRAGGSLNEAQTGLLGLGYDSLRQRVFPNAEDMGFPQVGPEDIPPVEGVRWIDERLLGGLNKPRPLATALQYPGLRHAASFFDAVNNATKFSILFLKPAYAAPNMLGNSFLLLTQQGVFAPVNIARAVKLSRAIGPTDTRLVDRVMGEGLTSVLAGREGGLTARATQIGSAVYGVFVDQPFRRASFLYEARKAGYRTSAQVKGLLHDEAHAADLQEVTTRANRAIIDYGHLTPVEQDIIRRVLFFYPWLKGSTRYAKDYLSEHPQQAALLGQEGKQGKARQQAELGPVPPFAEGLFKVGERDGMPLVSNPTAAGILGQPADLAAIASAALSGHVPRGRELSSLLTPFLGAGSTALSGYDSFTGRPVEPNARTFLHELTSGQPLPTLISRLRHDQSQRLFPLSRKDALLQFLVGGISERPVNRAKLNTSAEKAYGPRR